MPKALTCGIRKTVFSSQADAEDYLSQIAESVSKVKFNNGDEPFHISYAGGSIGKCSLHRASHPAISFSVNKSDEFHFLIVQKGGLRFSGEAGGMDVPAGRAMMLLPPKSKGDVRSESAITAISLFVSADALAQHASKLNGAASNGSIADRAPSMIDLADPVPATLARNIVSVFHEMQRLGQSELSSVARANFDDLLLGMSVMAISPVVRGAFSHDATSAGVSIARQARDYLRAHAAEPLSLTDLAANLGVGLRALQISFRREFGCSPREYLMTCRIELARGRLLAAVKNEKVASVALECGFTDLALFSRKYREAFGELPSETLRWRA